MDRSSTAMTQEIPFLDLVAQHRPLKDELLRVFDEALDHAAFVGGAQVAAFETEFARFVGSKLCVGVSNGTDALRLALLAMGIGPGDTVVTVPNTFIATTEAISQVGARFDFVDVDPATCLMDPNCLEDYLKAAFAQPDRGRRPTAIVPVHLYGQCAEMEAIVGLSKKYDLAVLEDAAQAHGATHKGRRAGIWGDAAAFSFYAAKNLGACGEAGAVTTADTGIAEKVRMLREHGQRVKYYHAAEGYNGRLDALQAGFLRVKLRHLDGWNAARRKVAARYDAAFAELDWVDPVVVKPHNDSCHHLYVIHVPDRDALQEHLKTKKIASGLHYPLPLHLQECYAHLGLRPGSFPEAERSASRLLSLPIFPELDADRVSRVVEGVKSFRA